MHLLLLCRCKADKKEVPQHTFVCEDTDDEVNEADVLSKETG